MSKIDGNELKFPHGRVHMGQNPRDLKEEYERKSVMRELSKQNGQKESAGGVPIGYFAWKLLDVSEIWIEQDGCFLLRIIDKALSFIERMSNVRQKMNEAIKNAYPLKQKCSASLSNSMRRQSGKMDKPTYNFLLRGMPQSSSAEDW